MLQGRIVRRERRALRSLSLALIGMALIAGSGIGEAANKNKLGTYEKGKPVVGLSCSTPLASQSVLLMGGGTPRVEAAFSWMIEQSRKCSGGEAPRLGNLVVVRVAGNPEYDSLIYKQGELASVQTVVVPTIDIANSPELDPYIQNASAIWLTGGDQGDYYEQWKGTRLARLIQNQVATFHVPIGGTSAGMMMMSEFNYIASPYAVTSADALANPYKEGYMAIVNDFWTSASPERSPMRAPIPGLENHVTDSHFSARDRMGRLVAFLARIMATDALYPDGPVAVRDARAIGVDQEAALLLEYSVSGRRVSFTGKAITNPGVTGYAYLLQPTTAPTCSNGQPLAASCGSMLGNFTFAKINVIRLGDGSIFDFVTYQNSTGPIRQYVIDVTDGVLSGNGEGNHGAY